MLTQLYNIHILRYTVNSSSHSLYEFCYFLLNYDGLIFYFSWNFINILILIVSFFIPCPCALFPLWIPFLAIRYAISMSSWWILVWWCCPGCVKVTGNLTDYKPSKQNPCPIQLKWELSLWIGLLKNLQTSFSRLKWSCFSDLTFNMIE